jgi:hypothetical protein
MRRLLSCCLALVLVVGLVTAVQGAPGDREVNAQPLVTMVPTITPSDAAGACVLGNLNPGYWAIGDWIWGAEKYKYLFYADQTDCSACGQGFTVESVTLYVQFGTEDVPVTFDARVDFEEAAWDDQLGCWVPGPEICVSSSYSITINQPGGYLLTLPMDTACACAAFGYWYGISFEFLTAFNSGMEPDLITDNYPVGCTSWNDYGAGWEDLVTGFGFPGEIIMYADMTCCPDPVPAERDTWGSIKSMFR